MQYMGVLFFYINYIPVLFALMGLYCDRICLGLKHFGIQNIFRFRIFLYLKQRWLEEWWTYGKKKSLFSFTQFLHPFCFTKVCGRGDL